MLRFKGNEDYAKCLSREKIAALLDWEQEEEHAFTDYTILSAKLAIKLQRLDIGLRIFANTRLRKFLKVD